MDKKLVVWLAEIFRLNITIRADGSVFGPDARKLVELYLLHKQTVESPVEQPVPLLEPRNQPGTARVLFREKQRTGFSTT